MLAIVIESAAPTVETGPVSGLETYRLRLGHHGVGGQEARQATWISIGVPSGLSAIRVEAAAQGALVMVRAVLLDDPLEFAGRPALPAVQGAMLTEARRLAETLTRADAETFLDKLRDTFAVISRQRLLAVQSSLTLTAHQTIAGDSSKSADLLASLLQHRAQLRTVNAEAESIPNHDGALTAKLNSAIVDIDALTQFVLSRQALDLSVAAHSEAQADRNQAKQERKRQRRLERLASALLVPGLWLAFWSTAAAPVVSRPWSTALVAGVAVLIAVAFWWLAQRQTSKGSDA